MHKVRAQFCIRCRNKLEKTNDVLVLALSTLDYAYKDFKVVVKLVQGNTRLPILIILIKGFI